MLGQWSIRHQGRKVFTFPHAVPEEVGKKFVKLIDNEFGTRKKGEDDFLRIEFWAQHQWDLHCIEEEEEYQEELRKHNFVNPNDVKFFFTDPKTGENREIKPITEEDFKKIDKINEAIDEMGTKPFGRIDNDVDNPTVEEVYGDEEEWKDMEDEDNRIDWIMDRDMPHHLEEGEEDEEDDSN